MTVTLRQLELFVALPGYPTLAAAAAALHISESGLSHAISELERNVGEQLCVRRKARGLTLTPAGRHVAARARKLLRDADDLVNGLSHREGELHGPVDLGCYSGLATTVVPPVLSGLRSLHPELTVEIAVGADDDLLPALHAGRLDVAIVYDMMLPADLQRKEVYETEVMAVLPEDHRLAAEESVALEQLASEPLVVLDSIPSTANTHKTFREAGLTPNVLTSVPMVELVRALVGQGLGYSLLMSRPTSRLMTSDGRSIVTRPLRPRTGITSVVAVWPQRVTLPDRVRAVVDYTVTAMQALRSTAAATRASGWPGNGR